ncbi:unnamed protein product [Absidia cylindrospora]
MSSQNTLYVLPLSLYSIVGVLLLWEKGVQERYSVTPVDLEGNEHNEPHFIKLNPLGKVPILIHDGRSIPDSLEIARFLDNYDQAGPLRAYDDQVLAIADKFRQISVKALKLAEHPDDTDALSLHAQEIATVRAQLVKYQQQYPELGYDRRIEAYDARAQWLLNPDVYRLAHKRWHTLLDQCELALANSTHTDASYLVGDQHTLADVYATAFLFSALKHLSFPKSVFANRPHLQKYYERQLSRPAVVQALAQ